jgi:carbon monoxide dehydrogenase subunit G
MSDKGNKGRPRAQRLVPRGFREMERLALAVAADIGGVKKQPDGRWTHDDVCEDEDAAITEATGEPVTRAITVHTDRLGRTSTDWEAIIEAFSGGPAGRTSWSRWEEDR